MGGSTAAGLGLLPDREGPPNAVKLLTLKVEDEADKWDHLAARGAVRSSY